MWTTPSRSYAARITSMGASAEIGLNHDKCAEGICCQILRENNTNHTALVALELQVIDVPTT